MLPNLVIAGAPRCGTTSFFAWLAAHPDVCGGRVKETGFFLDPDDPDFRQDLNYRDHGLAGYRRYFDHCRDARVRIVIEATPDYLYQETAPRVLSSLDPPPQIIFLLRKPSERSYSHFTFLRDSILILDSKLSFREYIRRLKEEDQNIPTKGHARKGITHSLYVNYLNQWIDRFPESHWHIFLFEHLKQDSRAFMRKVADQIGIDHSFYDTYHFPHENPTVHFHNRWLHSGRRRLGQHLPLGMKNMIKKATAKPYARLNAKSAPPRTAEDSAVLLELEREFAPYNERLARDLDLDLSLWL